MSRRAAASRTIFESPSVLVGQYELAVSSPQFDVAEATRSHVVAFPRSSVWILHEGALPFVAHPGTACFYNASHPYRRQAISAEGERCDWLALGPSLLRETAAAAEPGLRHRAERPFRRAFARLDATTSRAQRAIVEHLLRQDPPDALFVEEVSVLVVERALRLAEREPRERLRSWDRVDLAAAVEAAQARMLEQPARPWTLEGLARDLGLSPFQLSRGFRRFTGTTLGRWWTGVRLEMSLECLGEFAGDLDRVAARFGFSDAGRFSALFRRWFGILPSAVARRPVPTLLEGVGPRPSPLP